MPARPATAATAHPGSAARKALLAALLLVVASVALLGFGGTAQAATVRPAAPTHRTCVPTPNPSVDGIEVVGPATPAGSSELGAALGAPQLHRVHPMRSATPAPVGPHGYYAVLSAFWLRAVDADPSSC